MNYQVRRVFLAGILCGAILMAAVGAVLVWWKSPPKRQLIYDGCLAQKAGNTTACDALMRVYHYRSR
jgi:hypothetical protein